MFASVLYSTSLIVVGIRVFQFKLSNWDGLLTEPCGQVGEVYII